MKDDPEEISLQEIAEALWLRRGLIVGLTVLCGLAAVGVALILPVMYQSSVLLSPVVDDSSAGKLGGASALLSQVGGLAALGGVSLGGGGQKSEALATLQSAALAESFIADKNLLPVLYPSKWDDRRQAWKDMAADKVPTPWKAEKMFSKKIRAVAEDKKTGLVTLTITWKDPVQAAAWATELVARTNQTLRDRAIAQSKKNLDYLNDQLSKTSVVELQRAIYTLTESEIKKVMIANGSDEFAFKVIDPARVPEEKSSPKQSLIVIAGIFIGMVLGIVLVLALQKSSLSIA